MSLQSQYRSLVGYVDNYSALLETLKDDEFQLNPAEGVWSYSEVYSHVFQANLGSLIAAEKCINGTAERDSSRIHWLAGLILFIGLFPPGKIKAPARIAAMVKKISKEEARNLIVKFRSRLELIAPEISKAAADRKVRHPRLGLLNAAQWFRFMQIHTRHHERQLDRIRVKLRHHDNAVRDAGTSETIVNNETAGPGSRW